VAAWWSNTTATPMAPPEARIDRLACLRRRHAAVRLPSAVSMPWHLASPVLPYYLTIWHCVSVAVFLFSFFWRPQVVSR
jgi:hypothetical protein